MTIEFRCYNNIIEKVVSVRKSESAGLAPSLCGGSHSIVVGVPSVRAEKKSRFEAVRCPWMSTVMGAGTRAGAISEPLGFRIADFN